MVTLLDTAPTFCGDRDEQGPRLAGGETKQDHLKDFLSKYNHIQKSEHLIMQLSAFVKTKKSALPAPRSQHKTIPVLVPPPVAA